MKAIENNINHALQLFQEGNRERSCKVSSETLASLWRVFVTTLWRWIFRAERIIVEL